MHQAGYQTNPFRQEVRHRTVKEKHLFKMCVPLFKSEKEKSYYHVEYSLKAEAHNLIPNDKIEPVKASQ